MRKHFNDRSIAAACILSVSISATAASKTVSKVHESKQKNIVFILSDDHRFDFMGFLGKVPWLKTPNLDKIARNGVYMKNAYVNTSLSSPSRASILTGQYTHVHQIVDNESPQKEGLVFFPSYLQKKGYQTAFFGKWHMGNANASPRPGFNHWESFKGQGEYYGETMNIDGKEVKYSDTTYIADIITNNAIAFIKEQAKSGKPFFTYISHKGVHGPFTPSKRRKGIYKGEKPIMPENFKTPYYGIPSLPTMNLQTQLPLSGKEYYGENMLPNWVKNQRESYHGVDYAAHREFGWKWEEFYINYCEAVTTLDDHIGKILDCLKEQGLEENTLLVYMGDNGYQWGEHGLIDKRNFYEASARVPMLAMCPAIIKPGEVIDNIVMNLDIAPTLLDYAGVEKPEQMVGSSMIPLMKGDKTPIRDRVYYEYYWDYGQPATPTTFGVRTQKYKYITYYGIWDTSEMYDLENDPYEMKNLILEPSLQPVIKQLNNDLYDWLKKTDGLQIPLTINKSPHFDHRNAGAY